MVFQCNLHGQDLPQGKGKKNTSSVSKEAVYVHHHFDQITRNKDFAVESSSKWTWTASVIETTENIEPNDNDWKLNGINDMFSKIFLPEM